MKKVLIVDDVEFIIDFQEELLKALSKTFAQTIHVDRATSMSAALKKIADNTYDAMVLDINLPDGLGLEVAKAARSKSKETLIAMLTISPDDYQGYSEYFDAFLKKPVLADRYRDILKKMLKL